MPEHPPVTDWVHDFDHTDRAWTENPFPIWEELRAECPVVHHQALSRLLLPTTYEAVKEIAYVRAFFLAPRHRARRPPDITATAPPITSDPPEHKPAKPVAAAPRSRPTPEETGTRFVRSATN